MIVSLGKAIELLQKNEVVAMPTETVYGLAARIDSDIAIKKIFSTKERPFFDPLIVHVSSIDEAKSLTSEWNKAVEGLVNHFWPGPLTIVISKSNRVSDVITSGLTRVGIRMPKHPMALALIKGVGVPLAAPSANKFGKTSPTKAIHVEREFQKENIAVIDGGDSEVGIESTVLLVKTSGENLELSILRHGAITKTQIEMFLTAKNISFKFVQEVSKMESPGHMKHHYMPEVPLVMIDEKFFTDKATLISLIGKNLNNLPDIVEDVKIVKPKGEIKNLQELELGDDPSLAARFLYAKLRELSENKSADLIYFVKKPQHTSEEWLGIMDRLTKASSLIFEEDI